MILVFVLLVFINCNLSITGKDTIQKKDAELEIGLAQIGKAWVCGLEENSLFTRSLGNGRDEYRFLSRDQDIYSVYEKKAVNRCIEAIYLMPCPNLEITPSGKPYMPKLREDFVAILTVTRKISCTFETISIWEGKEYKQGRIY